MSDDPNEVWQLLARFVTDSHDPWRRAVSERTGMPFSRFRVLHRLMKGSMTVTDLARSVAMDPPATSVTVNDLERRGLVTREVNRNNRRYKQVTITDTGRNVVADAMETPDVAPVSIAELDSDELHTLHTILGKLVR